MGNDTKPFWNRLLESQILDKAVCASLKQSFQSLDSQDNANPENLADWLCEKKAISIFQAHILLADCPGPFKYGNYLIVDRLKGTLQTAQFLGRHATTGHPVLIDFVAGSEPSALYRWKRIRSTAGRLAQSPHLNLLRVFESVAIPQYRFIVSEVPNGQPLLDRVPLKSRLPWIKANFIVRQAALVLAHLHDQNINNICLFPDSLWITNTGLVQLMFPFEAVSADDESNHLSNPGSTASADKNRVALGELWYRLVTGQILDSERDANRLGLPEIKRLRKFEVPDQTIQLIQEIIAPENLNGLDAEAIVEHCQRMAPDVESPNSPKTNATLAAYDSWLSRSPQSINSQSPSRVDSLDFQIADKSVLRTNTAGVDRDVPIIRNGNSISDNQAVNQRGKSGYSTALSIAGSALAMSGVIAIAVALIIGRPNSTSSREAKNSKVTRPDRQFSKSIEPAADLQLTPELVSEISFDTASNFDQILIDDDGLSLWETPTVGPPISFRFAPPAPKMAFAFRPAELSGIAEGKRLIRALGPEMNGLIEGWQQQIGLTLGEIARTTVTLHSGENFSYETFFIVETMRPVPIDVLLQDWGRPKRVDTDDGQSFYAHGPELAYRFVELTAGEAKRFVVGPQRLVEESLKLHGADPLTGSMKTLASWSDSHRHASVLFLRSGLFDDAGQKLMSGPMAKLNRQLSLAIDTNIRGGLLSLHLDRGTYMELKLDRTDDLRAAELDQSIADLLERLPIEATEFSNQLIDSSYWRNTRKRFSTMIANFPKHWRIGSEDKRFIANCWLPETAAHNLIASTELILTFSDQRNPDVSSGSQHVPQNLEELLAAPRDLAVSTSPDLIILINNLEQEIRDDYGSLPFDFEIRLSGNDLSKDGITQNQRPGNFEIRQQPLSDILTKIMVQANPNKNINGASDLNCKLVWVIAADPADASREIILITTRSAAAENSYQLPAAFVSD